MNPARPLDAPPPSFPDTANYLLQAPPYYSVGEVPRSFGSVPTDRGEIEGVELDLGLATQGELHLQAYVRTWGPGIVHCEELTRRQITAISAASGERVRVPLNVPLRTEIPDRAGLGSTDRDHPGFFRSGPPSAHPAAQDLAGKLPLSLITPNCRKSRNFRRGRRVEIRAGLSNLRKGSVRLFPPSSWRLGSNRGVPLGRAF